MGNGHDHHGKDHDNENEKWNRRQVVELRRIVEELVVLNQTTLKIASQCSKPRRAASFGFSVGAPKLKQKGTNMPLEVTSKNTEELTVTLNIKTDAGKPSTVDGAPAWTVISGNSQVIVSEDGLSADLVSSDQPGDTVILVKADANLDPDPTAIEELSDTITYRVIADTAKNLGLTASAARPKREVVPPA